MYVFCPINSCEFLIKCLRVGNFACKSGKYEFGPDRLVKLWKIVSNHSLSVEDCVAGGRPVLQFRAAGRRVPSAEYSVDYGLLSANSEFLSPTDRRLETTLVTTDHKMSPDISQLIHTCQKFSPSHSRKTGQLLFQGIKKHDQLSAEPQALVDFLPTRVWSDPHSCPSSAGITDSSVLFRESEVTHITNCWLAAAWLGKQSGVSNQFCLIKSFY